MTIKQKVGYVEIEGSDRIEVRRMTWKAHREFFKRFAAVVATMFKDATAVSPVSPTPDVITRAILAKLPDIIAQSDDLATHLGCSSTSMTPAKFDDLDGLVALEVINRAIEINCDDEVKNCFAEIGGRIAGLISANTKTS